MWHRPARVPREARASACWEWRSASHSPAGASSSSRRLARERPCVLVSRCRRARYDARADRAGRRPRAGAAGYLLKNADPSELDQALRAVARGETWVSPGVSKAVVEALAVDPAAGPRELLTPRQREILQLVAEGDSTKEIAHRLQLSVK